MSTIVAPLEASVAAPSGGSFLIDDPSPEQIFTPEDFSEEQRRTGATADRFMSEEVAPAIPDYERKAPGVARGLVEKAAEIGLPAVLVPEQYDGLEMDVTTQMVVNESVGRYASFSTTYGAHAGIGTLPLVFFGTEEQKRKYLPKLVTAELLGAYCLSEPQAGSDALASLTRAELAPDGRHYLLNGQKMWISNGGWADLFTVFAKVDGEKFSAFLVERSWEGVRPGAEEHKNGHPRQLDDGAVSRQRQGSRRKSAWRGRTRPRHRLQCFESRPLEARLLLRRRREKRHRRRGALRQSA